MDAPGAARRRRWRLAALAVAVTLGHLWLADGVMPAQLGDGASDAAPKRMDISFVRELAQTAPPSVAPVAAPAAPPARPRVAQPAPAPEPAASAARDVDAAASGALAAAQAEPAASANAAEPPSSAAAAEQPTAVAVAPAPASAPAANPASAAAMAAAAPASSASAASHFEWPPSTRLSYRFTGNYRGPVEGVATVEWLHQGARYQVQMEVVVGSNFAPLLRRRVSSEGEVTPQGLSPRRYDEETKAIIGSARRSHIDMGGATVRLANGAEVARPPGLQDSASQFVHLTWLFTTQPQWLERGRSIEMPLALPRRIEPWVYDVLGTDTLDTPAGRVPAVHVKPRREPRPGDSLTAEMWVAPSLQYLPVRIVIRQDADTFVDMLIDRLPQQAER